MKQNKTSSQRRLGSPTIGWDWLRIWGIPAFAGMMITFICLSNLAYAKAIFQYDLAKQTAAVTQAALPTPVAVVPQVTKPLVTEAAPEAPVKKQVHYEVRVIEVNHSTLEAKGIQFDSLASGLQVGVVPGQGVWLDNITQIVQYLESQGAANVLAKPSLLTLEGEQSKIQIGDRLPVAVPTDKGSNGVLWRIEYIDTGVILNLKSVSVGSENVVTQIDTEVSHIQSWRSTQAGDYPVLATRKATGTLRIAFDQPVVIGGLLSESDYKTHSGLPILRDLPLIGGLFQSEQIKTQKSEIMIVVLPTLIV